MLLADGGDADGRLAKGIAVARLTCLHEHGRARPVRAREPLGGVADRSAGAARVARLVLLTWHDAAPRRAAREVRLARRVGAARRAGITERNALMVHALEVGGTRCARAIAAGERARRAHAAARGGVGEEAGACRALDAARARRAVAERAFEITFGKRLDVVVARRPLGANQTSVEEPLRDVRAAAVEKVGRRRDVRRAAGLHRTEVRAHERGLATREEVTDALRVDDRARDRVGVGARGRRAGRREHGERHHGSEARRGSWRAPA